MTRNLAGAIPLRLRPAALIAIKAFHTVVFASVGAALVVTLIDGAIGRPRRRTAAAGALVAAETAVFLSNNQVCPFTPLAEELGAERGSVVDMFLPAAMARRIPLVAGTAAALSMGLNAAAVLRTRR